MSCAASPLFARLCNLLKSIHNSLPISLRLPPLPCYPREDRCGSKVLWDPDGTFLTIRFGLLLENYPLPVCDTNVSSSARNERTPHKWNSPKKYIMSSLKHFHLLLFFPFPVWMKGLFCICLPLNSVENGHFLCACVPGLSGTALSRVLWLVFREKPWPMLSDHTTCDLSKLFIFSAQINLAGGMDVRSLNFYLIKSYIAPSSALRIIGWLTLLDFPLKLW